MLPEPCLPPQPPVWTAAPGAPAAVPRERPELLVHQARFHVGDTLWLTPLLRALQRRFPGARTTVVGPPVARELFAGNPHVQELVPYVPSPGREREERRRVLGVLAERRFDAALFAFARRRESRWLAKALAAAGVPCRINLEYVDPALDTDLPAWLTHEGWFSWGTLPSPRMLLHALDPLLVPEKAAWTEEDRRVELYVSAAARRRADELLAERGIGNEPFAILAPGGRSSLRWPARSFARLAARLAADGFHVLIEGSSGERDLLEAVAGRAGPRLPQVIAAADPLDVFAALLERARLLVANDSASIHLAEAAGTPTVYFAQREKLIHSHPAGDRCRALWDAARPSRVTAGQALAAIRDLLDRPPVLESILGRMRSLRQADEVTVARPQDESLDLAAFPGTWTSSDPGTRGVARLDLAVRDGELVGRIWGGGANGLVDWGPRRAEALFVDAVTSRAGAGFLLRYDHGFLTSHVEANLKLGVAVLCVYQSFQDASGRQDYFFREFLSADGGAGAGEMAPAPAVAKASCGLDKELGRGPGAVDELLLGHWHNTHHGGSGILEIALERRGDRGASALAVRVWGAGAQGLTGWGKAQGELFTCVEEDGVRSAAALARYDFGFMECELQIRQNKGILAVTTFNSFRDGSGRSSYVTRELFYRGKGEAG